MILEDLFQNLYNRPAAEVVPLAAAGSSRRYYRLSAPGIKPVIGTIGTSAAENAAFISLCRRFNEMKLPVPRLLAATADGMAYLQEDLGDRSLFDAIECGRASGSFNEAEHELLAKTIEALARFHNAIPGDFDYSVCFPQQRMDCRMIRWDLSYFKYDFLKLTGLEIDEIALQEDFDRLEHALLGEGSNPETFIIRDCQSRNVMLRDGDEPVFIDFQGGRKGPAEYDVASLLYQAKANLPSELKNELLERYINLRKRLDDRFDSDSFRERFPAVVLFRILQTLGAYGFRGLWEKKQHFLESIPRAIAQFQQVIDGFRLGESYPYLRLIAGELPKAPVLHPLLQLLDLPPFDGLTLTVGSFSYKKGIPTDVTGNGGGFVFDCRAVHNPGRFEQYKLLTGEDLPVIEFFREHGDIFPFVDNCCELVAASVKRYVARGFRNLSAWFGCTGGRHRSVFSANAVARRIHEEFPEVRVVVYHREQNRLEILK